MDGRVGHREGWVPKNWYFLIVVLEKTLEGPLDCKKMKPVNSEGNQPWIFIGRTDGKAEAPISWLPDGKSRLTGTDPDAGKDWRSFPEEKGPTEDVIVREHHRLSEPEFWANSKRSWRTGKPGMLQVMGGRSQTQLSNTRSVQVQLPPSAVAHPSVSAPLFCCRGTVFIPWGIHTTEQTHHGNKARTGEELSHSSAKWKRGMEESNVGKKKPLERPIHRKVNFRKEHVWKLRVCKLIHLKLSVCVSTCRSFCNHPRPKINV